MHKKRTRGIIISVGVAIVLLFFYIRLATNQKPQNISSKAAVRTTCNTLRLKGNPDFLPDFLDDYRKIYCLDTTPRYGGNNKCYTKTLACSINRIETPYWCVSAECYSCYNEEVDLSLCKAGATENQTICDINDAKWRTSKQTCDFGAKKIEYDQCSSERYRCMCDSTGKYPYPIARFDLSCPDTSIPTNVPGAPSSSPSGTICQTKDAKWTREKHMCDLGSGGKKLLYKTCTPDGYMCKCDDAGRYLEPRLQKDSSCGKAITRVNCDMDQKLQIIKKAYDSGDYKTVYKEMKKNFELSNTQSKPGISICYMPEAKVMDGSYCGKLQLSTNLSAGCACVGLIENRIAGNLSTFDYSKIKELKTCELAIQQINAQLSSAGNTDVVVVPATSSTSAEGVNTTPSSAGYSYQGNKLPWNGYIVNTDNCLLLNNTLTGYIGDPTTLKYTTASPESVCAK